MGTLRRKELWRNPNHICQVAILFLGKPRQKLERHKDLAGWDILPGSARKLFKTKEDKSTCVARPRTEDRRE